MIIDPYREGCTIWEGNNVQRIKGTAQECCNRIAKYILREFTDDYTGTKYINQISNIQLDTAGIGMIYADYFKHKNIKFDKIKYNVIIN